ncbi:hypothetical protein L0F51_00525 [Afifella sp. H1R]|uniref:hypothetical protein n=1 Tax=Afifella sp. H1R TaxID=2908841 RepID=UPI001F22E524|nr:hypothetical protein [Afifella sp. H1R]MCF1502246.1 hypothetical protein [Afifella sp. H1R]
MIRCGHHPPSAEAATSNGIAEEAATTDAAPAATAISDVQPVGAPTSTDAKGMPESGYDPAGGVLNLSAEDLAPLSLCAADLGSLSVIRRLDAMSGPLSARSAETVVGTARAFAVPFRHFEALREFGVRSGEAVTYILVGRKDGETLAYVGETGDLMRRLDRHKHDKQKAFAEMVFVVTSKSGLNSKDLARHRQAKYAASSPLPAGQNSSARRRRQQSFRPSSRPLRSRSWIRNVPSCGTLGALCLSPHCATLRSASWMRRLPIPPWSRPNRRSAR